MKKIPMILAAVLLALVLAGCGEEINDTPGYEVPDIHVAELEA